MHPVILHLVFLWWLFFLLISGLGVSSGLGFFFSFSLWLSNSWLRAVSILTLLTGMSSPSSISFAAFFFNSTLLPSSFSTPMVSPSSFPTSSIIESTSSFISLCPSSKTFISASRPRYGLAAFRCILYSTVLCFT